jgi:exonuclease VII small subunit
MGHQRSHQTKAAEATRHKTAAASVKPTLPTRAPLHPILRLQQIIGNRAVTKLIQAKLKVSQPGDVFEQEADRVADQVMRMPEPSIRRQMEPKEEEEGMVQGKAIRADVQANANANQVAPLEQQQESSEVPSIVNEALSSPGQPLDPVTRAFMEPRFGQDFSRVRVHSDAAAERSAQEVNAHAYTVNQNIVFGAGRFAPGTQEGRRLLAHELTHVVQQSSAEANVVRRSDGFDEDEPTLEWERAGTVVEPSPLGSPRGAAHRPGGTEHANVVSGEIETGAGPTSGGGGGTASELEGKAATAEAKVTRTVESVAELGKLGALDVALFYLQIHAAHFAALENVSNRVEIAKDLLNHVAEFENGARALRDAVNKLQRAEAALPEVTELLAESVSVISVSELEYVEAYANSAGNIVSKAFDARVKLNKIINGWDAVVAQGKETRDFTRKAVVEAVEILDFRFTKEKGGSFRGFLIEARDDAGRVEAWARSKWYYAKDILDSANLPLKRAMNEVASIRNDLMTMAKRGGVSAGVLVAIDYLKVAQGANDSAVALQAVKHSLSVLQGISGIAHLTARLSFLQGKLEALNSD